MPYYFKIKGQGITSYSGEVNINLKYYPGVYNAGKTIIYVKPDNGSKFFPVATSYDKSKNEISFTTTNFGDFAFGIPQSTDSVYSPILFSPADSETVIGDTTVELRWGTRGLVQSYRLQISNDDLFDNLVFDKSGLTSTQITVDKLDNNTRYYWRVNITDAKGTGDWSNTFSFLTAPPYIKMDSPGDSEVLTADSTYIIRWETNIADSVNIILLKDNIEVLVIGDSVSSSTHAFEWEIPSNLIPDSSYSIKITSIDNPELSITSSGSFMIKNNTTAVAGSENKVKNFALYQNYPNPFNPSTIIKYSISGQSHVKIVIFNELGQKITTLVNSVINAGNHEIRWNASRYSSGIYFCSIKAADNSGKNFYKVMKMMLLK